MLKDNSNPESGYVQHLIESQDDAQTANLMSSLVTLIGVTTSKQVIQWLDRYHASDKMRGLREVTLYELTHEAKISSARAEIVLAAIRLGRATWLPVVPNMTVIDDIGDGAKLFLNELSHLDHERILVACMNSENAVLHIKTISIGNHNECLCDPKSIFKTLLKTGATRWIMAHNHPSGGCTPSPEDLALTEKLLQASQNMSMPLLDHFVIGNGTYTSLRARTSLWDKYPQND